MVVKDKTQFRMEAFIFSMFIVESLYAFDVVFYII